MSSGDGGLTRREFTGGLAASGSMATGLAGGLSLAGREAAAAGPELANTLWFARSVQDMFFEPPVVRSANGEMRTDLLHRLTSSSINSPETASHAEP